MKSKKKISLVIPILNEAPNLKKLIKLLRSNLKKYFYEIIFVDDDSRDGSKQILLNYTDKRIRYILRKGKIKDLTKSCFLGIQKSRYENILIMDGDLQHNPKYLKKMLSEFFKNNYDFVIAIRDFNKRYGLSTIRYLASLAIIKIFSFFLKIKLNDPMSGFFVFKKIIYKKNQKYLFKKGYKILLDLFYNPVEKYKFKEIKFKFEHREKGSSKMSFKVILNIISLLFFKLKIKNEKI